MNKGHVCCWVTCDAHGDLVYSRNDNTHAQRHTHVLFPTPAVLPGRLTVTRWRFAWPCTIARTFPEDVSLSSALCLVVSFSSCQIHEWINVLDRFSSRPTGCFSLPRAFCSFKTWQGMKWMNWGCGLVLGVKQLSTPKWGIPTPPGKGFCGEVLNR